MKITLLRLHGFKSFVDATELVIEPGLTGVVGPNGCGKSNLLEALRWVMGETSHKSMRAAAMDDVIFSGTASRPERNSAEVTMVLDNSEHRAPAGFNDDPALEITRRIEREAGSAYRVNGRDVRGRDVKVLFEDAATGARSPALVRQGQIGEIVNAKPEQRRRILEDAAGIAGLHTRRHEAELRLRAAETNLGRLGDVAGQLSSQLDSLKRQARQARRYKDLSGEIRRTEALVLQIAWMDAQTLVASEEAALTGAMTTLSTAATAETEALAEETLRSDAIPALREAETTAADALGRVVTERDSFDREVERAQARAREIEARLQQLRSDRDREMALRAEATESLERIAARCSSLEVAEAEAGDVERAARTALDGAEADRSACEARYSDLTSQVADIRARRKGLQSALVERRESVARLELQIARLDAVVAETRARAPDAKALVATTDKGKALAKDLSTIETATIEAEEASKAAQRAARARRDDAAQVRLAANAFSTERETIAKLLAMAGQDDFPPIVDSVRVAPGFETALGAALGDDLEATSAEAASVRWRRLDVPASDHALPSEADPLSLHCDAPLELRRRLQQIGVVDRQHGARLQPHLKAGQRLVSREGDLWRWDGFIAAASGVTPAAQRLAQKNRLLELDRMAGDILSNAKATIDAERAAADALVACEAEERRLRQLGREKHSEFAKLRDALNDIERKARDVEAKLAAATAERSRAAEDLERALGFARQADASLQALDGETDLEPELAAARAAAETSRQAAANARVNAGRIESERTARQSELNNLGRERERTEARLAGAAKQIEACIERIAETASEAETLSVDPDLMTARRNALVDRCQSCAVSRRDATERLADAEALLKTASSNVRIAQADVANGREAKARIEARLDAARSRRQDEARRIRETFEVAPENCLALAGFDGAEMPLKTTDAEQKLSRLKADRERLGGVNLQADDELVSVAEQLATLQAELSDVEQAIAKLRSAIGQLNREGKSRLDDAFKTVNGHFERLFTHLFGGGEARLEMIESPDDPLQGGLEIIAKPPGKKPATLSLLSGGEQTLTALSLIFAVFLTNPSPICVLDEVDAPLDDSNVDRFCRLMEQMARETDTRFLVITHHPMTMSRMNRLFGVTMAEKGVSQLVSVNLETAQRFQEAG